LFCNLDFNCVIESPDVRSIYEIPLKFAEQGIDREVIHRLRLETKEPDLAAWKAMTERILNPGGKVRIAVVGKYTDLSDAYKSVQEALIHGGIPTMSESRSGGWAATSSPTRKPPAACSRGTTAC
jgi:CTP synthase